MTKDATPQKIADVLNSPKAKVENKIEGIRIDKTGIYKHGAYKQCSH